METLIAIALLGLQLGVRLVSIGQDILDAVRQCNTAVDSLIAFIQNNPHITQAEKDQILSEIAAQKAEVDAALAENVPPTSTP